MADLSQLPVTLRRHRKALVPHVILLLFFLALAAAAYKFWPEAWPYKWAPLALLALFIVLGFVVPYMRWRTETFTITPSSVRNDWGVLYRQSREIDLTHISSISEERGILDRLCSCGTLNFYDAAAMMQPETSGPWNQGNNPQVGVRFHDVPRLKEVRELVEAAKRHALH